MRGRACRVRGRSSLAGQRREWNRSFRPPRASGLIRPESRQTGAASIRSSVPQRRAEPESDPRRQTADGPLRGKRAARRSCPATRNLEQEAFNDYATEKYFVQPKDTRGEVKDWVSNYTENLVKTNHSLVFEITRAYAKERDELYRTKQGSEQ